MTTLRCTLLVVLLLNMVLFIDPGQATAASASRRCYADYQLCRREGVRCRECRDVCLKVSKNSPPVLSIIIRDFSSYCNGMIHWSKVSV